MHDRAQATGLLGTVEQMDQRKDAVGHAVEKPAVQQLDAREKVRSDLALAAAMRFSRGVEEIIAVALISNRGHRPLQQQDGVDMIRIEGAGEAQQGMILAVEPEYIAVDDEKRIVEQRQGVFDAAAGVEELGFVRDLDARVVA